MKKRLKKFFTLSRNHDGFTLVELIVVIAVLAILAGAGTVGYSGYIKNANKKADKVLVGNIIRALETANNSGVLSFVIENQYATGLSIPVGYIVISNEKLDGNNHIITLASGAVSYNEETGKYSTSDVVPNDPNSSLTKALIAAFGSNYGAELKLKSPDWNASSNSSFFEGADSMVDTVDQMGTKVLDLLDSFNTNRLLSMFGDYDGNGTLTIEIPFLGSMSEQVFSQGYEDSGALLLSLADLVAKLNRGDFIERWNNLSTEQEEFGIQAVGGGREHYSALRAAYSTCFSSYVKSFGDSFTLNNTTYVHDHGTHATDIANYGEPASDLIVDKVKDKFGDNRLLNGFVSAITSTVTDVNFPLAVCDSTIAGGKDAPTDFKECNACKALYASYKSSEQDKEDAANFYDTMATGAEAGPEIYANSGNNKDVFFDWMKANAKIFADLHSQVKALVGDKSAIVLVVNYDGDKSTLDVQSTPSSANPRK